jgi:hypothetical protein
LGAKQIQWRRALAGGLGAVVLLLAACGGGGGEAPEPRASFQPGDGRVKWNPGHYIQLNADAGADLVQRTFAEIAALPNVRGVQTRYAWRDLEPAQGAYDFSRIEQDLAAAQAAGKRLFIMLGTKSFKAGVRAMPDYLHADAWSGGAYAINIAAKANLGTAGSTGENVALWDAGVRDRLIALTTALGQRFDTHPAFEGVAFNETALGDAVVPLTASQKADFFTHLAQLGAATRQAFPNTVVMQFINFPPGYVHALAAADIAAGVALGGPDTFLADPTLEGSAYTLYDAAAGQVPLGPSVQAEDYVATQQDGAYAPPAVTDLFNFAKGRLHANYVFWAKTLTPPLAPYAQVLAMFRSASFPADAAGGLSSACPAQLRTCVPAP